MPGKKLKTQVLDNLTLLCHRGQELSSISDLDLLLNRILETAMEICNATASSIIKLNSVGDRLYFKAAVGGAAEKLARFQFDSGQGIAGWVIKNRMPVISNDLKNDPRHYKHIDEMTNFTSQKMICVPIMWENEIIGVIEVLNKIGNEDFNEQDLEYLTILSSQAGASLHITSTMEKLHNFFVNMLEILMMATETLGSTQGHSVQVARLAMKIAREIGVSEKHYKEIYYASLIHDIGRIKVAKDRIVGGERLIPILGSEMIRPIKMLNSIAEIVETHHERWDGSGFPKGLVGEEIPLGARIIGLAEDYVAWIEEESYRKQFDPFFQDEFFRKITKTHDPKVVEAFKTIRKRERESKEQITIV